MVTDFQQSDVGANPFDYAGRLVAVDGGQVTPPGTLDTVNIAMANRAGFELHFDFARLWRVKLKIFYTKRLTKLMAYCCFQM